MKAKSKVRGAGDEGEGGTDCHSKHKKMLNNISDHY